MADEDFKINVRTTYDGSGVRRLGEDLEKVKRQQAEADAKWAKSPLNPNNKGGDGVVGGGGKKGEFTGLATGFLTMIGFLTSGVNRWKAFNEELNRSVDLAIKAEEKFRELGNSIVETQDKMISQKRTASEPLADSFVRLQKEVIKLKTEQSLLDLPTQGEEWKEYQKKIADVGNELKGVIDKLGGMPPPPTTPGPKAKKGESQAIVDEIERNRKAADEASKEDVWEFDPETGGYRRTGQKRFPAFQPTPQPPPQPGNQYPSPIGPPIPQGGGLGSLTVDILAEAFSRAMDKYWSK